MACTTILHTNEQFTNTSSKDINNIVESINNKLSRKKYVVRETSYTLKKWFKSYTIKSYYVYYLYNENDSMVQAITLKCDYESVYNYLLGVESGVFEILRT